MLERKGIEHETVWLLPGLWPLLLRTRGFRGGTVPALKLDGRRIQHSRAISRALEEAKPDPPLFPTDPGLQAKVDDAERWGEEVLQGMPRRILRWLAVHRMSVRVAFAREAGTPTPRLAAWINAPAARYLARKVGAGDDGVRATIAELPAALDRVDGLIADGVIGGEEPNAADFQVGTSVRSLMTIDDLLPAIDGRQAGRLAISILPEIESPRIPAGSLPAEWLGPLRQGKPGSRA